MTSSSASASASASSSSNANTNTNTNNNNNAMTMTSICIGAVGVGIGIMAGSFWTRRRLALSSSSSSSSSSTLACRPKYVPGTTPPPHPNPKFGKKVMVYDPTKLKSCYNLLISTVTPRPIALISSTNPDTNIDNCAPFSYFGAVGHDPPMLAIGFCRGGKKQEKKDTLINIIKSKEFAVNIMSEWYIDAANHTCGNFPTNVDEFEVSGLTKAQCDVVAAPRVKEAAATYECILEHVHSMTNVQTGKPTTEIILAKIIRFHIDEQVLVDDKNCVDPIHKPVVDTQKLKPLGRLGGNNYCTIGEVEEIARPKVVL